MHLNITNNHLGNLVTLGSYTYAGWNSFTVVCLVNQTMNANEAGSDPIVIQLPLCSPCIKTRLTALKRFIYIREAVGLDQTSFISSLTVIYRSGQQAINCN